MSNTANIRPWWIFNFCKVSMAMYWDVAEIRVQDDTSVWVRFQDGLEGIVLFLPTAFRSVFACLRDPAVFRLARIEDGVLTWPGELDLAPDAMHEAIAAHGNWELD
jgi:hypothetical protein